MDYAYKCIGAREQPIEGPDPKHFSVTCRAEQSHHAGSYASIHASDECVLADLTKRRVNHRAVNSTLTYYPSRRSEIHCQPIWEAGSKTMDGGILDHLCRHVGSRLARLLAWKDLIVLSGLFQGRDRLGRQWDAMFAAGSLGDSRHGTD